MPSTEILWRIHLSSPPDKVFRFLTTDEGRSRFWAESAVEKAGYIDFSFPNGVSWLGEILDISPPKRFQISYYGGTVATFELGEDLGGGTELTLTDRGVPSEYYAVVLAGWVSVLMTLKAAVDFGVDLRNHDPTRTWDQQYADN